MKFEYDHNLSQINESLGLITLNGYELLVNESEHSLTFKFPNIYESGLLKKMHSKFIKDIEAIIEAGEEYTEQTQLLLDDEICMKNFKPKWYSKGNHETKIYFSKLMNDYIEILYQQKKKGVKIKQPFQYEEKGKMFTITFDKAKAKSGIVINKISNQIRPIARELAEDNSKENIGYISKEVEFRPLAKKLK